MAVFPLLSLRSPTDVSRFVVPVIVDTVERLAQWTWADFGHEIGVERGEIVPAFADVNAATTISGIPFDIRVFAAAKHRGPYPVHGRAVHAMCGLKLCSQTTARLRLPSTQRAAVCGTRSAAIAAAKPAGLPAGHANKGKNGPTTEPLACEINSSHMPV